MSPAKNVAKDDVMCDCSGTTRQKILALCDEGIVDIDTISRKTGAVSGCGSCEYDIECFLDDYIQQLD